MRDHVSKLFVCALISLRGVHCKIHSEESYFIKDRTQVIPTYTTRTPSHTCHRRVARIGLLSHTNIAPSMESATSLHQAARSGDASAVKRYIADAANPIALRELLGYEIHGQTAVEVAMRAGHLDIACCLMNAERDAGDEMQYRIQRLEGEAIGNSREAIRLTELIRNAGLEATESVHIPISTASTKGVPDPRIISASSPTCSWSAIKGYAADQATEAAAGRGPRRTDAIAERYRRYSGWCELRGHTGVELILATAIWREVRKEEREGGGSLRVSLEPNVVPYHVDTGIEHWVMWYHPDDIPGSSDLDPSLFASHVRQFLPSIRSEDELVAFQNLPQFRSVPQMAHAHVFLRPVTDDTAVAVWRLRAERRLRSPWAESERLGGRSREVGWHETEPPPRLDIGLISTGAMSTAQATLFAAHGFRVFIGSRDPARARALATQVGHGARGGSHLDAIRASAIIFLNILPGEITRAFLEANREELANKLLVDPAAPYYYDAKLHPPPPHESSLTWDKSILDDETVAWASTFKSMGTASVGGNKQQPIEVCGDERAKLAVIRILAACGWEPIDCGGVMDSPMLEPRGPRRRKHARIAEYDAKHGMHPAAAMVA